MSTLVFTLRARTFRSLRRHRNYRIFFAGQLVSLVGSWMLLPDGLYRPTDSAQRRIA